MPLVMMDSGAPSRVAALIAVVTVAALVIRAIYALYFHPLAAFPGPWSAAMFDSWYIRNWLGGRFVHGLACLHEKYGDVVRTGPHELSFASPKSYNDIYGHATKGHTVFLKSTWYDQNEPHPGLVTERRPQNHREARKLLSSDFSAKALRAQSSIVWAYIKLFMDQVDKYGNKGEIALNVTEWYNWFTFDVIGDLTFGESFHALENAKTVPWIGMICDANFYIALADLFRRVPWLYPFRSLFVSKKGATDFVTHLQNTTEKVMARREMVNERGDFFSQLLSDKANRPSDMFLVAQGHTLITAGSETTATALAATTYYLTRNEDKLKRLTDEIRSAYSSLDDIDPISAQQLPYLNAVIEEGLRIFPPLPIGGPRESPGAMVDGHHVPQGAVVSTSPWVISHSNNCFHDAQAFRPERWLPPTHQYYDPVFANDRLDGSKPFSLGPRNCIGMNLAYMELRLVLSSLSWQYNLELESKDLDWKAESNIFMFWKKPKAFVKFKPVVRG